MKDHRQQQQKDGTNIRLQKGELMNNVDMKWEGSKSGRGQKVKEDDKSMKTGGQILSVIASRLDEVKRAKQTHLGV